MGTWFVFRHPWVDGMWVTMPDPFERVLDHAHALRFDWSRDWWECQLPGCDHRVKAETLERRGVQPQPLGRSPDATDQNSNGCITNKLPLSSRTSIRPSRRPTISTISSVGSASGSGSFGATPAEFHR